MAAVVRGEAIEQLVSMQSRITSTTMIPWDPDSPEHVERMNQQRIACGYRTDAVESWREQQREGIIGLYWIILPPSHPDTLSLLERHVYAHPKEMSPLQDTGKMVLSRHHTPDPELISFLPIGHISLDACSSDVELETSPSNGIYSISTFYISKTLQSGGLGTAALSSCERMAATDFGAKAITLKTIGNEEMVPNTPRRIAMNKPYSPQPGHPTNEDWYQRRGYAIYLRKKDAWFDTDGTGKRWGIKGIGISEKTHCMSGQISVGHELGLSSFVQLGMFFKLVPY